MAGGNELFHIRKLQSLPDEFLLLVSDRPGEDLRIRGPGELLGTRQSGLAVLEVADLYRDESILEQAREDAFELVEADPDLARPEHAQAAEALRLRWAERLSLAQVG